MRISIISIALAILVNSLTLAIVAGFQQEIKAKIIGFNAPFFISKAGSGHIFEAEPIDRRIPFIQESQQIKGVSSLQAVAFKPSDAAISNFFRYHKGFTNQRLRDSTSRYFWGDV